MKRILIGTIGLVALLSTNSWAEKGDQKVRINSVDVGATVTVTVVGTPSSRYLNQAQDSVKVFGSEGVAVKQATTGEIYAITAPEVGTNIGKVFTFSNIAAGSWVEIGSYTVTTGKNLKIYNVHATGDTYVDYKISHGVAGQELYLAVSPSYVADELNRTRPVAISGGTVVRIYAKTVDTTNGGTICFGGFEY